MFQRESQTACAVSAASSFPQVGVWRTCRAAVGLLGFLGAVCSLLAAEIPADAQALRRTRVVEVFENWKESVVFVTGPVVRSEKHSLAEFFVTDPKRPAENSVGTGFVIHESGYVVTNAHGVEKTVAPVVVLADRRPTPADLVALLHDQDLALLKVQSGRPLKAVRLARSGDLMIGETVVVIANPHGLLHTCTSGVLSAIGRATHLADVPGVTLQDMIQSDAGINPGSSGGPWFNVAGEVIGMTASMKKDAENIAFAVSATTLRKFLPAMIDVERRYRIATGLTIVADGACEVQSVSPDSPAAKAGLRRGDVITRLADRATPTSLDFHLALIGRKPGEGLAVQFTREGAPQTASLVLAERPKLDAKAVLQEKLGIEGAVLDPNAAKAMGLLSSRAVLVASVNAAFYGNVQHKPQAGDILARIGLIRPRNPEHAAELVETLQPGQAVDLVYLRRRENTATRIDVHLVLPAVPHAP
jgi:serine protease Do